MIRPPIKFPGGKGPLLGEISRHLYIGENCTYWEPFCGSGIVGINTKASARVLSDTNQLLTELLSWCASDPESLIDACRWTWHAYSNTPHDYYLAREAHNKMTACGCGLNAIDAARFVWLNKHGFNGLFRHNLAGEYNVPFGRYKNPQLPERQIRETAAALAGTVQVITCDYKTVLPRVRKGDVIYFDPPYLPASPTASFASYSGAFKPQDHADLDVLAHLVVLRGARAVISASDTPLTRETYTRYKELHEVTAPRSISRRGDGRQPAKELLLVYYLDANEPM